MNVRVYQTFGLYVDGVPIPSRGFGPDALDQPPSEFTGILDDLYAVEGWNRDIMPVITCPDPTPMHIQALDIEVESS
jgi:hypothetical protein